MNMLCYWEWIFLYIFEILTLSHYLVHFHILLPWSPQIMLFLIPSLCLLCVDLLQTITQALALAREHLARSLLNWFIPLTPRIRHVGWDSFLEFRCLVVLRCCYFGLKLSPDLRLIYCFLHKHVTGFRYVFWWWQSVDFLISVCCGCPVCRFLLFWQLSQHTNHINFTKFNPYTLHFPPKAQTDGRTIHSGLLSNSITMFSILFH